MRQVPLADQLRMIFQGRTTLIGGGVFLLSLFLFLFTVNAASLKSIHFIGKETPFIARVSAVIPGIEKNRVLYHYTVNKKQYTGDFYTQDTNYMIDDYIDIEYANYNPKHSRVEGETVQTSFVVMLVFVLVSFLFMGIEIGQNIKVWRLALWGKLTRSVQSAKEVGPKGGYILTYRYKDEKGNAYELFESINDQTELLPQKVENVLYLPKKPKVAIMATKIPPHIVLYDI